MEKCSDSTLSSDVSLFVEPLHRLHNKGCGFTSSKADDSPQALPLPHDNGGQNLAPEKAVLDPCGQGIETLVAQHRYLVVQSAAAHR